MKNKDIVPLLISILMISVSLVVVSTSDYVLDQSHYIGIGCLIVSTIVYFTNKKIYIFVFGLTLIAGLIGLLDFFYKTFKVGFAGFSVNPIFIVLLIVYFAFGKDTMNRLFPEKDE